MKLRKTKSIHEIIAKYFGIWRGKPWVRSIGKSSRHLRKRTPVVAKKTELFKGRDFEEVAKELGI